MSTGDLGTSRTTGTTRTVVWATCAELPDGDPDDHLALPALEAAGIEVRYQVWDDPAADWSLPTMVRSTWDYFHRREQYLAWVARVPLLWNPAEVVAWNTDKVYLDELAAAGIPVVASRTLRPGDDEAHVAQVVRAGFERGSAGTGSDTGAGGPTAGPTLTAGDPPTVVVKPTVSAGSINTMRHTTPEEAVSHAVALLDEGRSVLVQPYLDAVDTAGETGLVVIDGEVSHAFRKGQILHAGGGLHEGLYAREDIRSATPTQEQLGLAHRVTAWLAERFATHAPLLYARVDTVPGPDGSPVLLELELTEPSLWLVADPAQGRNLATALARRLRTLPG